MLLTRYQKVVLLSLILNCGLFLHIGALSNCLEQKNRQIKQYIQEHLEIKRVEHEIQKCRPNIKTSQKRLLAIDIFAGSYIFKVPLTLQLVTIKAETEFHPEYVGLYGEHGILQVKAGTFYNYYLTGYDSQFLTYLAGMQYLKESYEQAEHKDMLALAYYNAGRYQSSVRAMKLAWRYVYRCHQIWKEIGIEENQL